MTQRDQYRLHNAFAEIAKAYTYTPGQPSVSSEDRMIHRLAVKAQALAVEYGENLTFAEAVVRAQDNLRDVRAKARVTS